MGGPAQRCIVCEDGRGYTVYTGLRYRKKPTERTYSMVRCSACKLLYVWPRPGEFELAAVYRDHQYRAAELAVRSPSQCLVEQDALRCIERYVRGGRVLDVGCGAGHFLNCARQRGWEPYGVEIAPHSAAFAREAYGLPVWTDSMESLPFAGGFFDLITLIGVVEHVSCPREFLEVLRPLLRSHGLLFILTDNVSSWMHWVMRDRFPWLIPPEHLQLFSPRSIGVLLGRCGFELVGIRSKETIPQDAAIRGLLGLVRQDGERISRVRTLQRCVAPLVWASWPARSLLWQFNLGAQIYVTARKSG